MRRCVPILIVVALFTLNGCAVKNKPVTVTVFGDVNRVFETDNTGFGSLDSFHQRYPDIKVEVISEYNEWEILQKTRGMLSDKSQRESAPDVIEMPGSWIGELAASGLLLPLDDWYESLSVEERTDYLPPLLTSYRSDGKLYGMPALVGMQYLYGRKDLFKGRPLPKTLNDLIVMSRTLHKESDIQGLIFPSEGVHLATFYYTLYKIALQTCDIPVVRRKAHMLAYQALKILVEENQPDLDKFSHSVSEGEFRSGRAAMSINGNYVWYLLHQSEKVGFPVGPQKVTTGLLPGIDHAAVPRDFIWSRGYAINAATKHPEKALQVLKHLTSAEMGFSRLRDRFILPARKSVAVYGASLPAMQPEAVKVFYKEDVGAAAPVALEEISESPARWRESVERVVQILRDALKNGTTAPEVADAMMALEEGTTNLEGDE
ncbi:MAG: ABC transporter substrate-binding protein [Desulfovibrio sp.]